MTTRDGAVEDSASKADAADIPVVILCGGKGTRLRDVTELLPKPLVEIGPRPILWHIMKLYAHHGHRRFILCLGYKSWDIKRYFLDYRLRQSDLTLELGSHAEPTVRTDAGGEDWEITFAETGLEAGTGARLKRVEQYLDADTFMFTYGDGIGDVDISALLEAHRSGGRIATLTGVHPSGRYGELTVKGDQVTEFDEKPNATDAYVNGGFMVLERPVLEYLPDTESLMFEQSPLQGIARDGGLSLYRHEGFWMGMDTFREYSALNAMWSRGDAPWRLWGDHPTGGTGAAR